MPSIPISLREAKEPIDSRRPYLKPSTKEKGRKQEPKCKSKVNVQKKKAKCAKEGYAKRGAVKAPRRTRFLVVRVPNINKILPKRNFKSKKRLLVKTPS